MHLFMLSILSPAPSPLPSRSRSSSVGDCLGLGGGRTMRALVSHPSSNPKLLPFNRGELITVLVQEPHNGWLYGRTDSSLRCVSEPARMLSPVLFILWLDPSKYSISHVIIFKVKISY